jgi:hypothetical protein
MTVTPDALTFDNDADEGAAETSGVVAGPGYFT